MAERISYEKFQQMLRDIDVPDKEIAEYLTVDRDRTLAFRPSFVTDPELVDISKEDQELESAMGIGNGFCRWRRQRRFRREYGHNDKPILVSEGDSWFQFPFLIDETIDQLGRDHLIWSLGAAGDTAENMIGAGREYMAGLKKWDGVQAFLFSAAGNDVIGQDAAGKPMLLQLLKPYDRNRDAAWHINRLRLDNTLECLRSAYLDVIMTIRSDAALRALPILIHGYDYAFPNGSKRGDKRVDQIYAKKDAWLGVAMAELDYPRTGFRADVIVHLIDALYGMLNAVAARDPSGRTFVVDVRGALPDVGLWRDEIHATDDGYEIVADRFREVLRKKAGVVSPIS